MNVAVILAAGNSSRFGNKTPKQFQKFKNKMVFEYSLNTFLKHPEIDEVLLLVSNKYYDFINEKIKTCFVFRVRNIPAALYKAMGGFATNGVNMVRLESYMLDGSFTSTQFFAEIEGHPEDANVKLALEELSYYSTYIKMLGSFTSHS